MSTDALCALDARGLISVVSPSFAVILGFTERELVNKNFSELVHLDDQKVSATKLRELATARTISFENRLIAKDGSNKWFHWTASKEDNSGLILLVGKNMTDEKVVQTELKAENRNLAEAKARNEAALASIGDGVVVVSDRGEIIFINEQALSMLDTKKEEVIGKHLIHAIAAEDEAKKQLPLENHPMQQAMLHGVKTTSRDIYFSKKAGEKFPVAITATPIFLLGALIGGVLVFRDITYEKEVDRMKTEFISLASHQLRTPLSAVKWFAEILLAGDSGELPPEQKEMVNNIYLSNERMIDLVNSLLNISRIESGRLIISPRPTNLKKLLDEVLSDLTPKIAENKDKVVVSVLSTLPEINIDPKLIRHVYMNLLTNAIKYTPAGGEIHVLISQKDNELISQITDNGYGIPKDQEGKVFQKFFRADNVIKVETDGSGLGLYLVQSIVNASGGRIWFESTEGKGTTFWFSLPMSGSPAREGEVSINS